MKKILLFFIPVFMASVRSNAQQLPAAYLDSVKEFYAQWAESQKDFVYTVMDNTAYPTDIDFCLYRINFESLFYPPCIVYRLDDKKISNRVINDADEKKLYATDSILLSQDEADSALAKLQESKSFKWNKEIFPNAQVVDSAWFFSRWNNTLPNMPKPAYWTLSLPAFFRDGAYCLMFYRYYCGPQCGYEALIVYHRENGRWQRYGTLSERMFG